MMYGSECRTIIQPVYELHWSLVNNSVKFQIWLGINERGMTMALYTGVNAIKKVKDVDSEVLIKVPFYDDYVNDIEFYESKGGFPSLNCILDYLYIEDEVEDTDENYYKYLTLYRKSIERKEYYVEQINEHKLLEKFESKELSFITRRSDLAEFLRKELDSDEFYFRKVVDSTILEEVLIKCKDVVGVDFYHVTKHIQELKSEYDFEVHVS